MDNQEIISQIGLYLDGKEIYKLLTINKVFKQTWCDSQHFWKLRCLYRYGKIKKPKNNDWKLLYFTYEPKKPERPRTAFLMYLLDNRQRINKDYLHQPVECAKIAAQEWKNIDWVIRKQYERAAKQDKDRYVEEMIKYNSMKHHISKPKDKYIAYDSIRMKELQSIYPDRSQFDIVLMVTKIDRFHI